MGAAVFYGSLGGDERLTDNLAAENALPSDLRAEAPVEVVLQGFQLEYRQELIDGSAHKTGPFRRRGFCGGQPALCP